MNKSAVVFLLLVAGFISNTMGQFEPYQDVLLSTKTFAVPVEEETTAPALPVEETEDEEVVTDLDELEDTKSLLLNKETTQSQPIQPIQIISQLLEEQPLELEIVTLPLTTTTRVRTTTPPTTTTEETTTEQVTTTEQETTMETSTEKLITTESSSETTTLEETSSSTEEMTTTQDSTSTQIPVVDMTDNMMLDHQSISVQTEDKTVIEESSDSKTSELVIDSTIRDHMTSETEAPSSPVTQSPTTESSSSTSDSTTIEPSTSVESSSPPSSSSYSSSSVPISTIIPTVEITVSPLVTEKVILDELTTEASQSTSTPVSTTQKIETTTIELVEKTSTKEVSQEPETSTKPSTTVEPSTTIYYTSSQPLTKTESIILATVNIKVAVPLKNSSVHSNAASNKDFKIKADGIIQNEASSVNKICLLTGLAAAILSSLLI